jgi:hypothetical protein
MPDLDQLIGFDPGAPSPVLPPAEIRRRGDRLRRRRTALVAGTGALALALAVGAPVLALRGGGSARPPVQPAPSPAPIHRVDWITRVPAEFPLADGLPRSATATTRPDPDLTPICGQWQLRFEDSAVVRYVGESEDRAQRMLVLFADARSADAQLRALRAATSGCEPIPGPPGSGLRTTYGAVPFGPVASQADESYAFYEQVEHDDGLVSGLTLVEVTRTGNALYLDASYGAAGGDDVIATELQRLQDASRVPLEAMCTFSATTCGSSLDLPGDLTLDAGFETGPGESVTGPSPTINGVSLYDLCPTELWPGLGATDRLAVRLTAADHQVVRELASYGDADQAAQAVDAIAAACQGPGIERLDADTGYPDSVTFGTRDGDRGRILQVVRIGMTVLATEWTGTLASGSLAGDVPAVTDENRAATAVVDRACGDAGC